MLSKKHLLFFYLCIILNLTCGYESMAITATTIHDDKFFSQFRNQGIFSYVKYNVRKYHVIRLPQIVSSFQPMLPRVTHQPSY